MSLHAIIEDKLISAFSPERLRLDNDSAGMQACD